MSSSFSWIHHWLIIHIDLFSDIDECSSSDHTCNHELAVCVNVLGGYQCQCQHGYQIVKQDGVTTCIGKSLLFNKTISGKNLSELIID